MSDSKFSGMTDANYTAFAASLLKDPKVILKELTPAKVDMTHCASGINGAAGEIGEEIKRHVFAGKRLDPDKVLREMGDLEFYLSGLRSSLNITRNEVISRSIDRMSDLYQTGYTGSTQDDGDQPRSNDDRPDIDIVGCPYSPNGM